jgi:hypothetical protein
MTMTVDEMRNAIVNELTIELKDESAFSQKKLEIKVDGAIREVKRARRYPSSYSDEMVAADMEQFYSNIKNIALYDYNMIGVEGQSASTENNESRTYVDRTKLFYGIIPFAR